MTNSQPPAATTDYTLHGSSPAEVLRPTTPDDAAAALRRASDRRLAVVPWGTGSKQSLGNAPRVYDLALDVTALDQVLEYEPADLVVTAQAGIPLAALQRRLAAAGQFLALDPPFAGRATLGGTLATGASGPSRLLYGTARDLVLGLLVATPEGELVKSGGRVVKNVVGYDLNKLHVGGMGTAGVIVEATLKVHPLPAAEATVAASFAELDAAHAVAGRAVRSGLYPRAVDLVRAPLPAVATAAGQPWHVLVWAAGSPATVDRQVRDLRAWSTEGGAGHVQRLDGEAHQALWSEVREWGRDDTAAALLRLTCLPSQSGALVGARDGLHQGAGTGRGGAAQIVVRAGNGVAYVRLEAPTAEAVTRVAAAAVSLGGGAVLEHAPSHVAQALDAWDPSGLASARRDDLDLMRAIKAQFDPHGTLNPGRFVGGI